MNEAILFKILHRKNKFRNPNHLTTLPSSFTYTANECSEAEKYLESLWKLGISWTYPGQPYYPKNFLKMKEPPLFLEYKGEPFWMNHKCLSVVGTRKAHALTESWLKLQLSDYLQKQIDLEKTEIRPCLVSGGAIGVDQLSHAVAIKNQMPTIAIVPSGLTELYPKNLNAFSDSKWMCFMSEFEISQKLFKSHFYFRNRLIAALGEMTLVVQADVKSGSLLTVHHALENGRPVLTIPSHPEMHGFAGNLKLLQDGAYLISSGLDLSEFWRAELTSNSCL